jgi:hypothetical protein
MKAFGAGFKPLHDTDMGPSSGMSEELGLDFREVKSFLGNELRNSTL